MKYHNITHDDMLNGEGLRVVLWVSGCSHHCKGCHNPCTWDPTDGLYFDQAAKREIFEYLDKDYISGITLSGGDPLFIENRVDIGKLIIDIRDKYRDSKTIWLYTGYEWNDIKDIPFIQLVDIVVDGPFVESQKDSLLLWKGSKNQRVIDVKDSLKYDIISLHCNDYPESYLIKQ